MKPSARSNPQVSATPPPHHTPMRQSLHQQTPNTTNDIVLLLSTPKQTIKKTQSPHKTRLTLMDNQTK
eukprot:m.352760 g.352760  ORF g.352760 m.352760 type:complete len:68 (+) comp16608_c0_seq1:3188-3391(+)